MNSELKILHIEDSQYDAELIKYHLKNAKLNCEITVVDNRFDFQNALKYFNADIILCDHSLPNFNSLEALKILRDSNPDIPFILVTGAVSEEFAAQCIKEGADDYILKNSLIRLPSSIESNIAQKKIKREKENMELLLKKDQEEYNKGLKKANKELGQFAYIVAHDLHAPLRAIKNLSLWIEEDIAKMNLGDMKKNMDLLRKRVDRMEQLINGIFEYSTTGNVKANMETVNVQDILTEAIDFILPHTTFKIEIKENMPTIRTEKIKLQQVFTNLISNAVKHNHNSSSGSITIDYKNKEGIHYFSVADNGPGIEPEYREKIFEIFQTLKPKDQFQNTGIGLTIVKKIVEENGGEIWVESEKGKGAKFIFTWPGEILN